MTNVTETFRFRSSSQLSEATYDPAEQSLTVDFASGHRYRYEGVPLEAYKALCKAPSPGSHFHRFIRSSYGYEQL